ncbi:MAG: isoprenyl transferase [Acholeplasmataceae bacterium]|nr:isoprenyl transferase [Acholeplasmataceae bacterium]
MKNNSEQHKLPQHIAIIMDGNGTWAKKRGLARNFGHRKGALALKDIVLYASKIGIEYLTVFAFSTENWNRPQEEVDYLLKLPKEFLNEHQDLFQKNNIRIRWIGSKERLPGDVVEEIQQYEDKTKENNGLNFIIAFNYGGRDEIVKAVNNILKEGGSSVNEDTFSDYLSSGELPDVDLLIRTSKQLRISNFLLWKIAYSELYFTDVLWPDFKTKDLDLAIKDYQKRERRFGGIK